MRLVNAVRRERGLHLLGSLAEKDAEDIKIEELKNIKIELRTVPALISEKKE